VYRSGWAPWLYYLVEIWWARMFFPTWYEDKATWSASRPFVSTTVHLTFRSAMGSVLHHIIEHTAHHVDMSVPLYRLKRAQALLERRLAGAIVIQPFSWRWYAGTARRCKLYDFKARCWTDFAGRPTGVAGAEG
jgi:omega-6 fatty acid desaturase (delta-12 desaturase)